jgi:uncharacterized repeat protein (TIGR03803 family)
MRLTTPTLVIAMLAAFATVSIAVPAAAGPRELVLEGFGGQGADGSTPYNARPTLDRFGNLFGTTYFGGIGLCSSGSLTGCGTVFELHRTPSGWRRNLLYRFEGGDDGAHPQGVVVAHEGVLYGATEAGGKSGCPGVFGASGCGTIYRLANGPLGWVKTTLYRFGGGADGANPTEGLILDKHGTLYGNATCGGLSRCKGLPGGVVFALERGPRRAWSQHVLYTFGTRDDDGFGPIGGLVADAAGDLFGATILGGPDGYGGPGTVFEVRPPQRGGGSWHESILHAFAGSPKDGATPEAGLAIDAAGNLYGTTYWGGDPFCAASDGQGCGVAFQILRRPGGGAAERVLHAFEGVPDGSFPQAPLAFDPHGRLFGTTQFGGDQRCGLGYGCGTVFRLMPGEDGNWRTSVVHAFKVHAHDGAGPASGIAFDADGNLFGTTMYGGRDRTTGFGTVFELLGPLADD